MPDVQQSRNIRLIMICPVCQSQPVPLYTIERFCPPLHILRCSDCGLQMQAERPSDLSALYQEDYFSGRADYSYKDERRSREANSFVWQARLKNIARFIAPPADFLDVGCAFGGFVEAALHFGYRAQGLDISRYAVDYAESQGLRVHQGSLEPGVLPEQSFDIVSLVEVFEHLPEPARALEALRKIMRPNGLVLVQTANFLGLQALRAKARYHYYLPGHLFYYSTKNLRRLFSMYGFGDFRFFRGVDFGLWPKLNKSRRDFQSLSDYLGWLRIAGYHWLSHVAYRDFALTSSMVMYTFLREK